MTIGIRQRAPSLPLATVQYVPQYQDQLNNVLRLYFNSIDASLYEIVTLLNNGGYFPSLDVGTVNADTVNTDNLNAYQILATYLTLQNLTSGGVQANNIVAGNITSSRCNSSLFTGLGSEITLPHIGASDDSDQYAGGDDTPTKVTWSTLENSFGFTLASNEATAAYDGTYKIDYSLQLVNNDNSSEHVAYVWLKINGTNVDRSTTAFTIPKAASVDSYVCAYSTVTFSINAGDVFSLYWATDKAATSGGTKGIYIYAEPAQVSPYARPAIPSAIGAITYMSAPQPPLTRVVPIGPVGTGAIGTVTTIIRNNT